MDHRRRPAPLRVLLAILIAIIGIFALAAPAGAASLSQQATAAGTATATGLVTTFTLGTVVALIWKLVDFVKNLVNFSTQKNAIITQLTVWIVAFGVMTLAAHADITSQLELLPGWALAKLDFASLGLVALSFGAAASGLVDFKKARDNADSAVQPTLLK